MSNIDSCQTLLLPSGITIYYTGPSLEHGALPGLFYFALSGQESLCLDPYNQPVAALNGLSIRVYSMTLPAHGPEFDRKLAIQQWAKEFEKGQNIISDFVATVTQAVDDLISLGYLDSHHLAVAGLSRGGFMATHVAATDPRFRIVLGFAPAAKISILSEFQHMKDNALLQSLDLEHLIPRLLHTQLRYYIGNRDELVSTETCVSFVLQLADAVFASGVRSPPVELILSPSIGYKGHGTSPQAFQSGARWIESLLL